MIAETKAGARLRGMRARRRGTSSALARMLVRLSAMDAEDAEGVGSGPPTR